MREMKSDGKEELKEEYLSEGRLESLKEDFVIAFCNYSHNVKILARIKEEDSDKEIWALKLQEHNYLQIDRDY